MEALLRIATWTAAAALVVGLVLTVAGAPQAALVLHGGLWLLVATPVVRVLLALGGYVRDGDWVFAGITAVVLLALIFPIVRFLSTLPD